MINDKLTKEQIDEILIKVDEELELFLIENYREEILRNLSVSLKYVGGWMYNVLDESEKEFIKDKYSSPLEAWRVYMFINNRRHWI